MLAGTSIGGFISLAAAAKMGRGKVAGIALVNSAGRVLSEEEYAAERTNSYMNMDVEEWTRLGLCGDLNLPLPGPLLSLFSNGLLGFLKPQVPSICKRLYTERPENSDQRQIDNILRDAADPGAVDVFVAGAKLPPPTPANELFYQYKGPVVIVQGMSDPLNDARSRAKAFVNAEAYQNQVRLAALEKGGHCPHHEVPEKVNAALLDFLEDLDDHAASIVIDEERLYEDMLDVRQGVETVELPSEPAATTAFDEVLVPNVEQAYESPATESESVSVSESVMDGALSAYEAEIARLQREKEALLGELAQLKSEKPPAADDAADGPQP
uniref:AB hydrolase-1 domain-containing protein n=1 Tax=Phaeomonas parva TaxID=124430 RepID=A0A7S1XLU4_9STRA|mmetsp:Transcript_14857/g.44782  ORF Transcript_14857/g.44782 Transcript_14857/m.44782 type:complete len:326 (+) Transcript_14857:1-978(+)